jgi:NTF2 fold immunity protein
LSSQIEQAQKHLLEFMQAMNLWEVKFHNLTEENDDGLDKYSRQAHQELKKIYSQFVTPREWSKYGRLLLSGDISNLGWPPEYDPKQESIVAIDESKSNKLVLETLWLHPQSKSFTERRRYTLVFKDGQWLIYKRERFSASTQKWKNLVF